MREVSPSDGARAAIRMRLLVSRPVECVLEGSNVVDPKERAQLVAVQDSVETKVQALKEIHIVTNCVSCA